MIDFIKSENRLILCYTPEFPQTEDWVTERFRKWGKVKINRTFTFLTSDILTLSNGDESQEDYDEFKPAYFLFAELESDYYRIKKGTLTKDIEIYIAKEIEVNPTFFVADSNISVFRIIEPLVKQNIYIGGSNSNSIPFNEFEKLIKNFPNSHEKKRYADARITSTLRNYFEGVKDSETLYQNYLNKKTSYNGRDLTKAFQDVDLAKYRLVLSKLKMMLDAENTYTEKIWQEEILEIILILYPKYIHAIREVGIKDVDKKNRFLDFLLIDFSGHVDVLEVKRPFDNSIMSSDTYRGNYIPMRELSGTIMQIEKYLYYLNKWGVGGEECLNKKLKTKLPIELKIKITNPSGIIVMGRENNLTPEQKRDFEVVKRKYKNIVDIITYDNLIERVNAIIQKLDKP